MASSSFKLFRNIRHRFAKSVRLASTDAKPAELKKGPTETEKNVLMVLKFTAAFLPGVYIGAVMQKKGYLDQKKIVNDPRSPKKEKSLADSVSEIPDKISDIKKDITK